MVGVPSTENVRTMIGTMLRFEINLYDYSNYSTGEYNDYLEKEDYYVTCLWVEYS